MSTKLYNISAMMPKPNEIEYVITPIAYSVHVAEDNPIFGESTTHVRLEDEAAGYFITLEQSSGNDQEPGVVSFDMEALEAVLIAARRLINRVPKEDD